nr:MAG: RNA-dependent RNA polymerase [Totiviridae sp.]
MPPVTEVDSYGITFKVYGPTARVSSIGHTIGKCLRTLACDTLDPCCLFIDAVHIVTDEDTIRLLAPYGNSYHIEQPWIRKITIHRAALGFDPRASITAEADKDKDLFNQQAARAVFTFLNKFCTHLSNMGMWHKGSAISILDHAMPEYADGCNPTVRHLLASEFWYSLRPSWLPSLIIRHPGKHIVIPVFSSTHAFLGQGTVKKSGTALAALGSTLANCSADSKLYAYLSDIECLSCCALVLPTGAEAWDEVMTGLTSSNKPPKITAGGRIRGELTILVTALIQYLGSTSPAVDDIRSAVKQSDSAIEWLRTRFPGVYQKVARLLGSEGIAYLDGHEDPAPPHSKRWFSYVGLTIEEGSHKHPYGSAPLLTPDTVFHQSCSYLYVRMRTAKHRRHLKVLNRLFPPTSATDNRHQTCHLADIVWHTVHTKGSLTISGLEVASYQAKLKAINDVLKFLPVGTNQLIAISSLLTAIGHSQQKAFRSNILESGLLLAPPRTQTARLKLLSTLVRKCAIDAGGSDITPNVVSALAYHDLLSGRSMNVSDWQEEISNRCDATLHINNPAMRLSLIDGGPEVVMQWRPESDLTSRKHMPRRAAFYSKLRHELEDICRTMVTKRNTKEPLDRFIQRRHEWIASGSSAGAKITATMTRGRKARGEVVTQDIKVSKRAWAESLTLDAVRSALAEPNVSEIAHASEKYENGKARAIYGVEPMHYVINTYATKGFEERLHLVPGLEKGASGAKACALEQKRAQITANDQIECSMLDYADFNRHHSPEAQSILFKVFASLGRRVGADPDWVAANEWVAASKLRMKALFPGETKLRPVKQGMFSGTRSTDLINTLLNLAYFRIAKDYLESTMGVVSKDLYHVHQGDDVWISSASPVWARGILYSLNSMGFIFQRSKQMFGQGRGEYLRVLYSGGGGYGYYGRALSNYLLRPLQSATTMDPVSWARTVRDGCCLLSRRGLSTQMANVVYNNGISFWARARAHPSDTSPVSLPPEYLSLPQVLGGLGCPPPGMVWSAGPSGTPLPEAPSYKSTLRLGSLNVPSRMTDEWLQFVSEQDAVKVLVGPIKNVTSIREEMILNNYRDDVSATLPERGWSQYKASLAKWKLNLPKAASTLLAEGMSSAKDGQAAILAPLARLGYSSGVSPTRYPYWDANLYEITNANDSPIKPVSVAQDEFQSIVGKSVFKNEKVASRILDMDIFTTVNTLLHSASMDGEVLSEIPQVIFPLTRSRNASVLDAVVNGCGDLFPGVDAWCNTALWNYSINQCSQTIITTSDLSTQNHVSYLLARDTMAMAAWLSSLAGAHSPLFRVIY